MRYVWWMVDVARRVTRVLDSDASNSFPTTDEGFITPVGSSTCEAPPGYRIIMDYPDYPMVRCQKHSSNFPFPHFDCSALWLVILWTLHIRITSSWMVKKATINDGPYGLHKWWWILGIPSSTFFLQNYCHLSIVILGCQADPRSVWIGDCGD